VSGVLVPPADARALAAEIERLIGDRGRALSLGENARARIENRFDADKNVAARLALFNSPADPTSAPRSDATTQMSWQES
jgi:glycosyltransferase involved in cell wall biosynthesis